MSTPYPPPVRFEQPNSSLAPVTSLVTGLCGLFLCWIPILGIIAWVLGPVALVFGFLGLKRGGTEHKLMSVFGIVLGVIALIVCWIWLIVTVIALQEPA